ncbi:MAG: hypothetical protein K8R40_03115 [Anaerolineaceae bacterium]|nr:hypothetical protein [Anaerolineaceae bacterium]
MKHIDPSGHWLDDTPVYPLIDGEWGIHYDSTTWQPNYAANYNPAKAVEYAKSRTSDMYEVEFPKSVKWDTLCTIYVMDIVTSSTGGNWIPIDGLTSLSRNEEEGGHLSILMQC